MRESSAEMRNDHTHGTEHFTDMLQNENARRLGPTVEGPRCEAVWAVPLRTVCCIFPAVTWKDARLAPLLVWDTPKSMSSYVDRRRDYALITPGPLSDWQGAVLTLLRISPVIQPR